MGGDHTLIVLPRKEPGPDLWMQHRASGKLAALSEQMAGALTVPGRAELSWLLVSDTLPLPRELSGQ